jgi:hypothetical protein
MASVAQGVRASFVVAMGNCTNPTQTITGVFDDLLRGFALCKQPYDLTVAGCNQVFRFAILVLDLFKTEMRFDR